MTRARTTSSMTRNQRRRSSEIPSEVKLQKVVPEVPRNETERGELLEDFQTMGCSGLLEKPWGFKDDRIVRELLDGVSNKFEHSIRATLVRLTEECWREVYNFSKGGGQPYIRLLGTIPLVWDSLLRQYITFWGF
jgi:hypothetical protein